MQRKRKLKKERRYSKINGGKNMAQKKITLKSFSSLKNFKDTGMIIKKKKGKK